MALRGKSQPQILNLNKIPGQPKKRKKITLVFDESKRRDFLKGFHKRKLQRQKKAQEQLQQQLKEERKRIKHDAKERYKKLVSSRDIPELQELLSQKEFETEGHTVSILELNVADLAEGNVWIGENKSSSQSEEKQETTNEEEDEENNEEIIGMSLNEKKETKLKKAKKPEQIESRKDLKRTLKKAVLKQVKNSKVFQQKQRIEHQKNKKESRRKLKKVQLTQKRNKKLKKR